MVPSAKSTEPLRTGMRRFILPIVLIYACLVVGFTKENSLLNLAPIQTSVSQAHFISRDDNQTISEEKTTYQSVCYNITTSEEECNNLTKTEKVEPQMFPLQYVSGTPGSGNDWILWVSSLSRYTWPRLKLHSACEYYGKLRTLKGATNKAKLLRGIDGKVMHTNCLFLKTHEPWFYNDIASLSNATERSTLLLRHPYDSAFSEYKRRLVMEHTKEIELWKQSTAGLTLDRFINTTTNATNKDCRQFLELSIKKWIFHANYWLTEYPHPLHVLIYNSVKDNTVEEIENLQRFFGYKFDGVNFRRHCCVMKDSNKTDLKRKPTDIDLYKEVIYKQEQGIHRHVEQQVAEVNKILQERFVGENLVLTRG